MIFILYSVDVYHMYCFLYVELSLHSRDETYFIMMYDPFNVLLSLFCYYFLENRCIYIH